jgi:hypothetical protein
LTFFVSEDDIVRSLYLDDAEAGAGEKPRGAVGGRLMAGFGGGAFGVPFDGEVFFVDQFDEDTGAGGEDALFLGFGGEANRVGGEDGGSEGKEGEGGEGAAEGDGESARGRTTA